LGADGLATGHYARIERHTGGAFRLRKAVDVSKDQSYVLYMLDQALMGRLRFPLGEMTKAEVRDEARGLGLRVADKPDSQDVCFIDAGGCADFVRDRGGGTGAGPVATTSGKIVGEHSGLEGYTVGQRRGLGSHPDGPKYVVAIDAGANRVIVGDDTELHAAELIASEARWTVRPPDGSLAVTAKVRYNMEEAPATVRLGEDGRVHVRFEEPQRAVTPGQAVVFYDGDVVVGGATIDETVRR